METVQSPPVAQYHVQTPPLWANLLWSSSPPVLDIKEPLNSLLWAERVEQKEAEAAAHATAPADVLPESSIDGQMLPSTPADQRVDLCPALWGLDVSHSVCSIYPGQFQHIVQSLLLGYWTDLSCAGLTARLDWMLIQRQDLTNSLHERIA